MNDTNSKSQPSEMNNNSYHNDISEEDMKLINHLTWLYGGYEMRTRKEKPVNEHNKFHKTENISVVKNKKKNRYPKSGGKSYMPDMIYNEIDRGLKSTKRLSNRCLRNKSQKNPESPNKRRANPNDLNGTDPIDGFLNKKNRIMKENMKYMTNGRCNKHEGSRDGSEEMFYEHFENDGSVPMKFNKKMGKIGINKRNNRKNTQYSNEDSVDKSEEYVEKGFDKNKNISEMDNINYLDKNFGAEMDKKNFSVTSKSQDEISWKLENARYLMNRRLRYNYTSVNEHRKPSWPLNYNLKDKIEDFITKKIADATEFRNREPTTLSICNQFALQNHEAMVADSDRVHYYRAAIFWTGFKDEPSVDNMSVSNTSDSINGTYGNLTGVDIMSNNNSYKEEVNIVKKSMTSRGDSEPGSSLELVKIEDVSTDNNLKISDCSDNYIESSEFSINQTGNSEKISSKKEGCKMGVTSEDYKTIETTLTCGLNVDEEVEFKNEFKNLKTLKGDLNKCFDNEFNGLESLHDKFTSNVNYKSTEMTYENTLETLPPMETSFNTCYSDSIHSRSTSINMDSSVYNGSEDAVSSEANGVKYYCTGKKILEIGTGPMCVLAMNALNAGAKSIDALEVSDHASRLAGKLMAAYGFDKIIKVFNTHSKLFIFNQNDYFSATNNSTMGSIVRFNSGFSTVGSNANTCNSTSDKYGGDADISCSNMNCSGGNSDDTNIDITSNSSNSTTNDVTTNNNNDTANVISSQGSSDNATNNKGNNDGVELYLPPYPPYDMVISEILGDFASQEGVADVFLDFQRRILFENKKFLDSVKSIPCKVSTMFTPCFFPDASNILNKSSTDSEMTIFSPTKKMLQSVGMRIDNLPICEEWLPLEHLDLESWMLPQMCQHYVNAFKVSTFGDVAGLLVGIDIEIRPGEHFGTRYGQCESWYTNLLMFDREYTVFKNDLIVVSSTANLTNYTKVNCDSNKIQVSRPSYSFIAYILSPINFCVLNENVSTNIKPSVTATATTPTTDNTVATATDINADNDITNTITDNCIVADVVTDATGPVTTGNISDSANSADIPVEGSLEVGGSNLDASDKTNTTEKKYEDADVDGKKQKTKQDFVLDLDVEVFDMDQFLKKHTSGSCTNEVTPNRQTSNTSSICIKEHYSVKLECTELSNISYDVTDRTKINFYNLNKNHDAVNTNCKYADDILKNQDYIKVNNEIYKVIHRPEVIYIDYDEQTSTIYHDTPCAKRKMHTDPPKRYNKIKLRAPKLI